MSTPSPLAGPEPWNLVSANYAEELMPLFSEYAEDALERGALTAESSIVDVATGPGTLAILAAPRVKRVVGIDFSESMLRIARRRAEAAAADNVEFHHADGQALPLESETIDAAFSLFGLMFFPDRGAGFREMARVLRPGGRAVVSSWTPVEESPLLATLFGAVREALPELPFGKGNGPLSKADAIRNEMRAAGFREVRVDRVTHQREVASVRHFWDAQARSSAPIAVLKAKLSEDEWRRFAERVADRLVEDFGDGSLDVGWAAFLGVGER